MGPWQVASPPSCYSVSCFYILLVYTPACLWVVLSRYLEISAALGIGLSSLIRNYHLSNDSLLLTAFHIFFEINNTGGPSARASVLALGAGFGAGTAYQQNQALVGSIP